MYADEFARTGFQGGLQWYRCLIGKYLTELETFSHRTIDVPACFISGKSDWGVYQLPGALEMMETTACTQWRWCRTLGSARGARGSQSFVAAIHRRVRTGLPNSAEAAGFYGSAGAKVRQQISLCVELTVAAEILRRRIAGGRRLASTRAQERYALIPIVNTPLYAPEAPPVTIGVCAAICRGVLSAKTSSRSTLTEVKFAALAP